MGRADKANACDEELPRPFALAAMREPLEIREGVTIRALMLSQDQGRMPAGPS